MISYYESPDAKGGGVPGGVVLKIWDPIRRHLDIGIRLPFFFFLNHGGVIPIKNYSKNSTSPKKISKFLAFVDFITITADLVKNYFWLKIRLIV